MKGDELKLAKSISLVGAVSGNHLKTISFRL